jgi:hypothetical protein
VIRAAARDRQRDGRRVIEQLAGERLDARGIGELRGDDLGGLALP